MTYSTLQGKNRRTPPNWAVRQRHLFDLMDRAAVRFVKHATRPDGTLIQRTECTSMHGTHTLSYTHLTLPTTPYL